MQLNRNELYKCNKGIVVEVLSGAEACEISCCGEPMQKLEEKTADAATEKHVPVIEKIDGGYKVKVGSVPHPMESDHWIQWIEITAGNKVYKEFLEPGQPAEATFMVEADSISAREHCNKHGLWKA